MRALLALIVLLFMAGAAQAQNCTVPNTFINGTIIDAGQMNANMSALTACVNNVQVVNIKQFGGDSTGVGANNTALTAIFALTAPTAVTFPAGTYRVACPSGPFVAAGPLSLIGVGRGQTIIRLDSGCALTGDVFQWTNKAYVHLENLTIDLNTPVTTAQYGGLAFYVNGSNNLIGPQVLNSEVLNLGSSSGGAYDILMLVFSNSASWTYPIFSGNRLTKTAADATTANECLTTGGNGAGDSLALGNIHYMYVLNNVCTNSAMQIDGDHVYVIGNDVSGFAFGSGIYTQYNQTPSGDTSNHDCVISNNIVHDSPAGYDVNSTAAAGIETDCVKSVIEGNILHDNGGEGIRVYGNYTKIIGNVIFNNAKTTSIVGNFKRAGIHLAISGLGEPYASKDTLVQGNSVFDTGAGTQLYGYADESTIDGPAYILSNELTGVTAPYLQASPQGTLIGDPWQVFTSVLSCFSGTLTSGTGTIRYQHLPFKLSYLLNVAITTNGTCAGFLGSTLPTAADPGANSFDYIANGQSETTGFTLAGLTTHSTPTVVNIKNYDNSYPGANSTILVVQGSYAATQ